MPSQIQNNESKPEGRNIRLHRSILREFGRELDSNSSILDFGCGEGGLVQQYRNAGLQAFGADFSVPNDNPFLRPISQQDYRLPYDNSAFDFVVSNSVLEHVEDLGSALSEINRVLKPGGASLHLFPPRSSLIEPHLLIPLGGIIRNRPWLYIWALLGIRNKYQRHLNFKEVVEKNYSFLRKNTFYRTKRELTTKFSAEFKNVTFADCQMIKNSYGRAARLWPLIRTFPSFAQFYGALYNRCVFFEKNSDFE
jgi:SAM-dependent methyltransferase